MIKQITSENFDEKIKESCVIDFYAEWCGPCRMLTPILESISSEIKTKKFYSIDIDQNVFIAEKYNIKTIPTILVFEKGEIIKRIIGFKHRDDLTKELTN